MQSQPNSAPSPADNLCQWLVSATQEAQDQQFSRSKVSTYNAVTLVVDAVQAVFTASDQLESCLRSAGAGLREGASSPRIGGHLLIYSKLTAKEATALRLDNPEIRPPFASEASLLTSGDEAFVDPLIDAWVKPTRLAAIKGEEETRFAGVIWADEAVVSACESLNQAKATVAEMASAIRREAKAAGGELLLHLFDGGDALAPPTLTGTAQFNSLRALLMAIKDYSKQWGISAAGACSTLNLVSGLRQIPTFRRPLDQVNFTVARGLTSSAEMPAAEVHELIQKKIDTRPDAADASESEDIERKHLERCRSIAGQLDPLTPVIARRQAAEHLRSNISFGDHNTPPKKMVIAATPFCAATYTGRCNLTAVVHNLTVPPPMRSSRRDKQEIEILFELGGVEYAVSK